MAKLTKEKRERERNKRTPNTIGENKKLENRTYLIRKDCARLAKKLEKGAQALVKAKGLEKLEL